MSRRETDQASLGGAVAGFTVLGMALLLGAAWLALYLYAGDRAPRSARVEGVDIAHLAPAAAQERLRTALATRATAPIEVSYGDGRMSAVDPVSAGLSIDYAASVVAAGGGTGFSPQRLWQVASGGGDRTAVVDVDEQKMQTALDALAQGIGTPPVNGTVVFRDGHAAGVPGRPGQVIDRDAARAMLVARFLHQGSQKLPTRIEEPAVTADEVNAVVGSFGRSAMSAPVTLVVGGRQVQAPPRLFERALSMRVEGDRLLPQVDGEVLMSALTPLLPTMSAEPVDARVAMSAGRPVVVPARLGLSVDTDRLESAFAAALTRGGAARRVVVPATVRQPAVTTAAAHALGVSDQISSATLRLAPGTPVAEVRRSAALVDGTLLRPRETFSLAGVLGAPTGEGVDQAAAGPARADDAAAGPLASALFQAMFFAGLRDVAHTAPSVHAAQAPVGLEATLVWPTADLRFTDDTPYGVLVTATVRAPSRGHAGALTVSMWSTRTWDVTARTSAPSDVQQPSVRVVETGTCRPSVGSPGFGVDVVRVFRRPGSGRVVRSETFHTDYQAGETIRCARATKQRHS